MLNREKLNIVVLLSLTSKHVNLLLKNEAVDIYVMNEDVEFGNYLVQLIGESRDEINRITQIDKDDPFSPVFMERVLYSGTFAVYCALWEEHLRREEFEYEEGVKMAEHIQNLPHELIREFFDQFIEKYPQCLFIKDWKTTLLERKITFVEKYLDMINRLHHIELSPN